MLAGALNRSVDGARLIAGDPGGVRVPSAPPFELFTNGHHATVDGVACALDGALFNGAALAAQVGASPLASPAALVARGYGLWGAEVLSRLRGAFTVAIWDSGTQTGLVAQDHLAQRAIFYNAVGDSVIFGSEVREVLDLLPSQPAPDRVALVHWIAEHESHGDRTLYDGVRRLMGGGYLEMTKRGAESRAFWTPKYEKPLDISRSEAADELGARLTASLADRGAADPDAGVILSGGVDSSTIAAFATRGAGAVGLRSYSAVFPGRPEMDESADIAAVAGRLGLRSTTLTIEPQGALAASLDYLSNWKVPVMSPAYWLERSVAEVAAADGIRLAFDGQGGDELFGGSPYLIASYIREARLGRAWRAVAGFPGMGENPPFRKVARAAWGYGVRSAMPVWAQQAFRRASRSAGDHFWLLPDALHLFDETSEPWAWKRADGPLWWADRVARTGNERIRWGLSDYVRRRAADCGFEARSPLLGDVDLLEYTLRLPVEVTYTSAHNRAVVRQAIQGLVPDAVRLKRTKADFSEFTMTTLTGRDLPAVERLLAPREAEIYAYVSPDVVRERFLDRVPTVADPDWKWWTWRVWNLITAECWLRAQKDDGFVEGMLSEDIAPRPVHTLVKRPGMPVPTARG